MPISAQAGAGSGALRARRASLVDGDPVGAMAPAAIGAAVAGGGAYQALGPVNTIAKLRVAEVAATFGQDPTGPDTDNSAEDLRPFLDSWQKLEGAPIWLAMHSARDNRYAYVRASTIARNPGDNCYDLSNLAWADADWTPSTVGTAWNIVFGRVTLSADVIGLGGLLAAYVKLDGSNLTTAFKNAVRSPSDPYEFAADYTRKASAALAVNAGDWGTNAAPVLNGAAVQIGIVFRAADLSSATERWVVGNEFLFGTQRFRLAGTAVQINGNRYSASVVWIGGASQAGSARPRLEADTPHRSEFAAQAFGPDAPAADGTYKLRGVKNGSSWTLSWVDDS